MQERPEAAVGATRWAAPGRRTSITGMPLALSFRSFVALTTLAPVALVAAVLLLPMPGFVQSFNDLGRVPYDDTMSRAEWYAPAVEELREELGAQARLTEVSVGDRVIAFEVADGDRARSWAFYGESPRHLKPVPGPAIPAGATFSAALLDGAAPERMAAELAAEHGVPSVSVMELEARPGGAEPRWMLSTAAGLFTARADGSRLRRWTPGQG